VSSILKALKKIETTGVSEGPSGQQPPSGRQAMFAPQSGAKWYTRRGVPWFLVALFLAAGAAAYYAWSNGSPPAQTAGAAREVRLPLPPGQAAPPARPIPAPPPAPAPPSTESVDGSSAAGTQAKAAPSVQAPPPSSRIRPPDGSGSAASATRPRPAQRNAPGQERAPAPRPAPSRSPEDSLSRLEESKLKVMAIAWTDDPARRLAVVNGHIVKEGESVEGYNVMQIRKDDIIVNDGGRSWRVELNLKGQP
jgi:Type II secretion system protein B